MNANPTSIEPLLVAYSKISPETARAIVKPLWAERTERSNIEPQLNEAAEGDIAPGDLRRNGCPVNINHLSRGDASTVGADVSDVETLSAAFSESVILRGMLDETQTVASHRILAQALAPAALFYRQLKNAEFDISEFSPSSYAMLLGQENLTWAALPAFTSREFFHTDIVIRDDSELSHPEELRGKRVGIYEYHITSAVWIRGILEHEFGIAPEELTWYVDPPSSARQVSVVGYVPPPTVTIQNVDEGKTMVSMLIDGDLDAILFHPQLHTKVDGVRRLFADPEQEAKRFFAKTSIMPINHLVVVRRSLVSKPGFVAGLYDAFVSSRDAAGTADDYPYGIKANQKALETLLLYLCEQGMTRRQLSVDELFAPRLGDWQR